MSTPVSATAPDSRSGRPSAVTPDRSTGEPLWSQILTDLRRRLAAGEFDAGFPPDSELVETYRVSRHTVRDACRRLQDEGILTRERGRGSFVKPVALVQQVGPLYSVFRSIEDQGYHQRSTVLHLGPRRDPAVAERLGLEADDRLVHLHRIRYADDVAFAVDEVWLPSVIGDALVDVDFGHTALYLELENRLGISPVSGDESIRPALPSVDEAHHLGIDPLQPVFVVVRRTEHRDGPLEWRRTVVRGDLFQFATEWSPRSTGIGFRPTT